MKLSPKGPREHLQLLNGTPTEVTPEAALKKLSFEGMARDFVPNLALKPAGILCVFQGLHKQKLGQKIRHPPEGIFREPLNEKGDRKGRPILLITYGCPDEQ